MQEIKIIITAGIPGSGKTTWAKKMEESGFVRVSTDEIRNGLFNDDRDIFNREQNRVVWNIFADEIRVEALKIAYGKSDKIGVICECMGIYYHLLNFIKEKVVEEISEMCDIKVRYYYKKFEVKPTECRERIVKDIANGVKRADISLEELNKLETDLEKLLSRDITYIAETTNINEYSEY